MLTTTPSSMAVDLPDGFFPLADLAELFPLDLGFLETLYESSVAVSKNETHGVENPLARRQRRVVREKNRVRRRVAELENLRREQRRLEQERDHKIAAFHARNTRSGHLDQYLRLVEQADELRAANRSMAKEIEQRELLSAAVDTMVAIDSRPVCVDPREAVEGEAITVVILDSSADPSRLPSVPDNSQRDSTL